MRMVCTTWRNKFSHQDIQGSRSRVGGGGRGGGGGGGSSPPLLFSALVD